MSEIYTAEMKRKKKKQTQKLVFMLDIVTTVNCPHLIRLQV